MTIPLVPLASGKRLNNWLSEGQVQMVLESAEQTSGLISVRDTIVLRLGFTVGLRRQEIVDIRRGDIIWPDKIQIVGKGGKAAIVAMPRKLANWVETWEQEVPASEYDPLVSSFVSQGWEARRVEPTLSRLSTNSIRDITLRYSRVTGIRFNPHDMRRSFAGLLFQQTGSIEVVSAALRHSNFGTTQRYLERRQDAAYQAVQKVKFDI